MNFTDDVAKNIVILRNAYRLTQNDLAIIAGKSDKTISSWENGVRSPQLKTINHIAKHFGIDPLELAGVAKSNKPRGNVSDEEWEILMALRSMDENIRKETMTRITTVADMFPRKDATTPRRVKS